MRTKSATSFLSSVSNSDGRMVHNSASVVKYGQDLVFLKALGDKPVPRSCLNEELLNLATTNHENLNAFLGICLDGEKLAILMQYATRGSLYDVLHQETMKLSLDLKQSLMLDIASGMAYLHASNIGKSITN